MSTFGAFTVTRASTKNVLGSNGLYQSVANNVPAFEFNTNGSYRGLLVEPGATNQIRNNSAQGAVAGTPGTLPTHYSVPTPAGLTTDVAGVGTENGINYFDIRVSGTATSTTNYEIRFEASNTQIVATASQVWTHSAFLKVVSAPNPPNNYQLRIRESTSGGTFVGWILQTVVPTSNLLSYSATGTTAATTERVAPFLIAGVTNGVAYDFTIRIGWPQMETGSVATSPIVTTAGTANRAADVVSLTGASSLIGASGTLYAEFDWRSRTESAARIIFGLEQTGTTNNIRLSFGGTNQLQLTALAIDGGSVVASSQATLGQFPAGITKLALAYDGTGVQLFVNGTAITLASPTGSYPSVNAVVIGSRDGGQFLNDHIRACAVFPTRLSNAQIQSLTTL
jgi:hypothetical protein